MKPLGMTAGFQIVHPSRAENAIWDAVGEALDANMSVVEFIREARECWVARLSDKAKDDAKDFNKSLR